MKHADLDGLVDLIDSNPGPRLSLDEVRAAGSASAAALAAADSLSATKRAYKVALSAPVLTDRARHVARVSAAVDRLARRTARSFTMGVAIVKSSCDDVGAA